MNILASLLLPRGPNLPGPDVTILRCMHIKIYLTCTVDRNKTSRVLVTDETTQSLVKVLQGGVGLVVVDALAIISLHHAPLIAFLF